MLNSTIDYKLIGERIKKKRNEINLTQEKLAEVLHLSSHYISKIENGKVTPTLDTLAQIAFHLNLELSYLISGTSTLEKSYYTNKLEDICSKATNKQLDLITRLAKAVLDE